GGSSSWQELYEWWAQNNQGGSSSWQELYEWWAIDNQDSSSSSKEAHKWWAQDKERKGSWWQEVFFASQDNGNFTNIRLPGQNNNEVNNVIYGDITGGHEDDIIGGDNSNDNIVSGKGDDLVDGAEGDDTIIGGEGYDTIFGFDGNDSIKGGEGDDLISGESGEDVLLGEAGADVLMGGEQDDYLDGGEGRDFLNGDTGHDALIGRTGDDALEGGAGKDLLVGGEGRDIGNGGSGNDFIFGDRYSAILQQAFGNNLTPLIGLFTPETETNTNTETTTEEVITVELAQDPMRIEAENMTLSGNYSLASAGNLVQTNSTANISTIFNGQAGLYNIVIGYHDVYGNARITASLGSNTIDDWYLNQASGSTSPNSSNFKTRTIASEVALNGGESLFLNTAAYATSSGGDDDDDGGSVVNDKAYIDYVEFVPVVDNTNNVVLDPDPNTTDTTNSDPDTTTTDTPTTAIELGLNSDILRGGNGNDGIDGGEGNDIIFGEDELNDSSNVAPINIADSFNYGRSTYILSQAGTWEEAQAEAQSYGGNLVTINDAAEQAWIYNTFGSMGSSLWTGFTDAEQEGSWQWISGQAVTYTNWIPDQPDNWFSQGEYENYGSIKTGNNTGQWNDLLNQDIYHGIIEIDWSSVGGNDTIVGGAGDDQIYGNSGNDLIYGDDINDHIAIKTPQTLTFQQGVNGYNSTVDTQLHGYHWTTSYGNATSLNVDGEDLGYPVQTLIRFEDIFGTQTGQIALDSNINSAFLELDVSDPGSSFKVHEILKHWSDNITWKDWDNYDNGVSTNGVEASSTAVATTGLVSTGILRIDVTESLKSWQANPTTNYGWAFLSTGTDGVDFDSSEGANAPTLVVDVEQVSSSTSGIDGAVYSGSNYLVTDTAMTWEEAQSHAESIGGNLVTINDAAEEEWLKTTFGSTEELWIGLTDKNVEGQFEWSSGEALTYTNWVPGEPNNSNGGDYVRMNYQNQWGDKENTPLRGIIEIKLPSTNGSDTIDAGDDHITGNGGNDTISGGAGNDVINGTDQVVAGYYEKDILTGGDSEDKFILGDAKQAYYATGGHQDYAVIKDFDSTVDFLQLHGTAVDYQQQQQGNDIFLSRNGDLVAILEDTTTLNLSDTAFEYV
ncbi:MAG: lectin-like protein, partial [Cyanobacteria bacterium J06639_18]